MKEIETYCLFAVYLLSCCMTAFDVSDYFKGLATVPYPLFWANRVETHGISKKKPLLQVTQPVAMGNNPMQHTLLHLLH